MTHLEENKWISDFFSTYFSKKGYFELTPVGITSHIDKTVYLVNSATNLFKQYIHTENCRIFVKQRCMRTQALDYFYNEEKESQYPTCFVSFGAYVSKQYMDKLFLDTVGFLANIGLELSRLRVRVSEEDGMLLEMIESCPIKIKKVIDSQKEKYSHTYGDTIMGRAIKVDYFQDSLSRYKNICYIIAMYNEGILCGAELASSADLFLLRLKDMEYAISVSAIADILPTENFYQRRLADSVVAVVNLSVEGKRPHSSDMSGRTMKKYLRAMSYFGRELKYSEEEIAEICRQYLIIDYGLDKNECMSNLERFLSKYYREGDNDDGTII